MKNASERMGFYMMAFKKSNTWREAAQIIINWYKDIKLYNQEAVEANIEKYFFDLMIYDLEQIDGYNENDYEWFLNSINN